MGFLSAGGAAPSMCRRQPSRRCARLSRRAGLRITGWDTSGRCRPVRRSKPSQTSASAPDTRLGLRGDGGRPRTGGLLEMSPSASFGRTPSASVAPARVALPAGADIGRRPYRSRDGMSRAGEARILIGDQAELGSGCTVRQAVRKGRCRGTVAIQRDVREGPRCDRGVACRLDRMSCACTAKARMRQGLHGSPSFDSCRSPVPIRRARESQPGGRDRQPTGLTGIRCGPRGSRHGGAGSGRNERAFVRRQP